ncbi:AAA family ATPase [Gordonia sp. N1V]|uniref:ParA family protein n=1 Tax=Gordonia sp. N1V TaxID=3034163 RepID=UPI0023E1CC99|nr:AAA family ATPase [Gordonia sp. N1V]MDF3285049.1 AAA family ATPase [Gordonia sp. N1V]
MTEVPVTSVANLKGGVGKTLVVAAIAHAIAGLGKSALLVDVDPQGNLTQHFTSYSKDNPPPVSLADVLDRKDPLPIEDAVLETKRAGLTIVASGFDELQAVQDTLVGSPGAEFRLDRALRGLRSEAYAHVLLDCRPATDLVTRNAFVAADSMIVVLQPEFDAIAGWNQTLDAVDDLKEYVGKTLPLAGLVVNQIDARRKDHEEYLAAIHAQANDEAIKVLAEIPMSTDLSRLNAIGMGIDEYPRASSRLRYIATGFTQIAELLLGQEMAA